ncbi:hypothetical protein SADUNF_Sadunf17G0089900 [Salix dunnii]|uniref:Uncharacterized protein n=1 Tax=Salix dunnii TaxID=1413687 RepID=A0A835MNG4_9ROSI|nr:hypothetical protein SADUNF_Sadunf17G0089900 [Salix dunnii]
MGKNLGLCKRKKIPINLQLQALTSLMAPPPGPDFGTSTLALVARVSAFSLGLVYGSVKLRNSSPPSNGQESELTIRFAVLANETVKVS